MALWSTQTLTEMSSRNISCRELRPPVRRADSLTNFMCRLLWNLGASKSLEPSGLVKGLLFYMFKIYGDAYFLLF